ncbi:unnamed protein product [Schistosoma guineensis]|nr:unnamed protein product [Schistosoma guineensis]
MHFCYFSHKKTSGILQHNRRKISTCNFTDFGGFYLELSFSNLHLNNVKTLWFHISGKFLIHLIVNRYDLFKVNTSTVTELLIDKNVHEGFRKSMLEDLFPE